MDFHAMKRKELQELCKEHGVPANIKNVEMAMALTSIFKEKEMEQIAVRGKSCLKILDENPSDDSKKLAKKVQFSPQNEMFEFHFENDRAARIKAREMKKRSVMKMDQEVETKVSDGVAKDGVKMTRSRANKSMVGDVAVDVSYPKTRRNVKRREKDVNNVVEMDSNVDVRAAGVERGKRSADEALAGKCVKFETRKVLRRSIRNVTKGNSVVCLNSGTGDADTEFEAGGGTNIDSEVVVDEEREMVLQPTRAIGRKSSRQKGAVTFVEPENERTSISEKGAEMVENIEAPNENEKDLIPIPTLRSSRRQTTIFKSNASVNVNREAIKDVGRNKSTKKSTKSISCEQTLVTIEVPRRSTRNSSKHVSVAVSNDMTGNYNKNETRKRARTEPNIPVKVPVSEAVSVQETVSAREALSADVVAESTDFNTHGNSTIVDNPTNAIIDEELQGGIQINVENIEQSHMLIETCQLCVEKEPSSGHDTEVPIDTMCGNEIFRNVGDDVNRPELSDKDVDLNALETELTLNEDISTATTGIKLGCEIESVLMDADCQVVDYTESYSLERITDNVPEVVTKESMRDVSCGEGISPTTTKTERASGIVEDIPGMYDLEVPASHTNPSVREVATYPEPTCSVLDKCTYESSHKEDQGTNVRPDLKEENLQESELGKGNLNETVEVFLSQTASKVHVGEKFVETENASISLDKVSSYQDQNGVTAEIKEENKLDFDSAKSNSSLHEKLNELNTTAHASLELYDQAKHESREGGCATEICKAELGEDGDFLNGDAQVSRNTLSNFEETISKGMDIFEDKTSVEMIQTTFPCSKDIGVLKEEENSGTSQNTSPFTKYDATYDDKVRKEVRMEDFAVELYDDVIKERDAVVCLEAELAVDAASHKVVAQVNGSVSSNWVETIGEGNDGFENDTSLEMNLNTSACIKTIDMSMEEESGGTSPPVDRGPDPIVSDYGDEYANVYLNGSSSSSDSLLGDASDDSSGDDVKEKSELDFVKSISDSNKFTYHMMDTENDSIQQHNEMMSIDLTVRESEESHTQSSDELMPANIEVEDINENIEDLDGEFEFGHDKEVAVAAQFYASAVNTDTDADDHIEEVKAAEVHENSKDDYIYEHAEEKSDFVVGQSIFECNETTHLLIGLENDTTHETDELMTISLADHKDTTMVHEADEGNSIASNEIISILEEVRDRKETFRIMEVGVDICEENAGGGVMAVVDVFSANDEMGADNQIEELKLSEVHRSNHHDDHILEKGENVEDEAPMDIVDTSWNSVECIETNSGNDVEGVKVEEPQSSKDGDVHEKVQTIEETTHVTILRKIEMGMAVETSDYIVESIFECNASTHFLTVLENDTTDQRDELMSINLADRNDNKVQEADKINPLATKETMPVSVEVGERTEIFRIIEGEVNIGDENAGGRVVPVDLNASSLNNEISADNDMEEPKFAEALLSYHMDRTVEKTETVEEEARIDKVNHVDIVDASCSDLKPDTSHVTAASSLSSCKVSMDVNTPFKGDDDITLANKSLQDDQKVDGNKEADTGKNEKVNAINSVSDRVNVMSTTYAYLLEELHCERETTIVEEINEEAHGPSCFAKEMEEESVELAVSDYVVYDITMKPELEVGCFATSPVIPSAIHDNGTVELQVESSRLFSSREINIFLEESEGNESKPLTQSKALNEDSHYMEQKVTELNDIDRASLDEPIFKQVQSLKENDAVIATEGCFDHEDCMEQTVAVDNSYDNDAFVEPSFEQFDSLKENGAEEKPHEHGHHVKEKVTKLNDTDRDSLEEPISQLVKSVKENDTVIATEECSGHENHIEQRLAINSSLEHAALGEPIFEQDESFKENATTAAIKEGSKGENQTAATENSLGCVASDELIAETECMDPKISKHNAEKMEVDFSFSAKALSSSIVEVKKSRCNPVQRTHANEMMWSVDMKENTPMIKTEQTALVKQSTKRRALEDIQKI